MEEFQSIPMVTQSHGKKKKVFKLPQKLNRKKHLLSMLQLSLCQYTTVSLLFIGYAGAIVWHTVVFIYVDHECHPSQNRKLQTFQSRHSSL